MATFRQLILDASTLPQGSALRDHMNNLNAGGSGTTYSVSGIDIEIDFSEYSVQIDSEGSVIVLEDE